MRKKLAAYSIATTLVMGTTLAAEHLLEDSNEEALAAVISQIAEENGVNEQDEDGNTPLHLAIYKERHEDVHTLIGAGSNLEAKNNKGFTSLGYAVFKKNLDIVRTLIAAGANPNATMILNKEPVLFEAISWANTTDIARALLDAGANINLVDREGRTPLHILFLGEIRDASDLTAFSQKLLDLGADINLKHKITENNRTTRAHTALHDAVINGKTEIVRNILNAGAEVNEVNIDGDTVLHTALYSQPGSLDKISDMVLVLLEEGADANIKNNMEKKPINYTDGLELREDALSALHKATLVD